MSELLLSEKFGDVNTSKLSIPVCMSVKRSDFPESASRLKMSVWAVERDHVAVTSRSCVKEVTWPLSPLIN